MRILFYFLHNPWPPLSGAHQRCLQVLRGLKAAGHEVIFASSVFHSEQPWNDDSKMAISEITGQKVYVYGGAGPINRKINIIEKKIRFGFRKNEFLETFFCPYSLVRWFRKLASETKSEAFMINYAWFDQLVDHKRWKKIHRIIDTYDMVSINRQMWQFVEGQLAEYKQKPDASKLREDFEAAKTTFHLNSKESEIFQKYDTVLSIAKTEQKHLQSLLTGVQVIHAPFVFAPQTFANTYLGPPVLSLGPNPFNIQGFLYFQDVILPEILKQAPGFRLIVTGNIKSEFCRNPAIDRKGFVENRDALFQEAGYAVCPVFAGTGQQIKIVEAMAYGLAVVAFEEAAKNSFIKHGENGLVANSADEFARHVASLQNDMELRARLGQAARETIKNEWENSRGLKAFMESLGDGMENKKMARPAGFSPV